MRAVKIPLDESVLSKYNKNQDSFLCNMAGSLFRGSRLLINFRRADLLFPLAAAAFVLWNCFSVPPGEQESFVKPNTHLRGFSGLEPGEFGAAFPRVSGGPFSDMT